MDTDNFFTRLAQRIRQALCGTLTHHESSVVFPDGKYFRLRCINCGYVSPGIDTGGSSPRYTCPGDPERLRLDKAA